MASWNNFQAKHNVTLGNWMTIIIMLIHWYTSINSFHQLSYFEFAVCTINKMKFENKSEMASWNNFQAKHNVTLGNWMTIIIMLIHWYTSINSFHQLSYFEFAVCTINKMKFENKSEMASWNNFQAKHNVTLGNWMTIIIMLIQWYTYVNSFHQLCNFEFAVCTINKMKSWGHMKFEYKSEMASWNNFQAKHNVTLGNWMTIIIMLIQWYTYVNSFHQLCNFEFAVCTINKMKSWLHMKFEYKSEMASWNNFQAKHNVTLGNWMTIIIMLIHWYTSINSFHQLSYFEFAVCTINKMKFENKSEMASWNNFQAKHNVTLGNWMTIIIMLIHWYTSINSFH